MQQDVKKHTIWQTLALHLIPGALITAFFYLTAPAFMQAGYPALMSLMVAIMVILIPFELGWLLYLGHKRNGRFSLEGIVLYQERLPLWQYLVLIPVLLAWSVAAFGMLGPVDAFFVNNVFAWMPAWANAGNLDSSQVSQGMMATFVMGLVFNGVFGPWVEELYFRGYLLPRIPSSRIWAPLINVVLFSLYHFFSPWQNVTRIIALMPLVYAVAWKRDIKISIWVHILLNVGGMMGMLALLGLP